MNYCIMNIGKIKTFNQMSAAFKHNYREEFADNVIPEMEVFNQELVPMSHDNYNETFKSFTQNLGYGIDKDYRKNGVLALEVMLSFSREALPTIDVEKWKEDNIKWLRENFNMCPEKYGDNLLSAVYHADEVGNVHIHAFIAPVDDKGRLNAFEYTKGHQKMRELQDSYAEAMKAHGLERGMKHSPIKHQDIQKMYGSLNKALDIKDIPKWEENDTPESYQKKVIEYTKDKVAVFHKQLEDKQRELEKVKAAPKIETTALEKKLASANRKIHKMEKEKEELEREVGTVEVIKKTVESVRLMRKALEDMDVDKANEFTEQLNEMVARQRRLEREKEEEEKKRKKSIFEKIKG